MRKNLVCAGGGMRGIGVVGTLSALEREGISWVRTAGTSSGAIIAALVAAGYSAYEIKNMIIDVNFLEFKDKDILGRVPIIGNLFGFVKDRGLYSGNKIEKWIEKALEEKGFRTFQDFEKIKRDKLKIIAADITAKKAMIMPDCFKEYGIDIEKFTVAKAVRMSISIPLFFKPVVINVDGEKHYIVDGGVSENFKIDIFDHIRDGVDTIGIDFNYSEDANKKKDSALSYLFDIADTMTVDKKTQKREYKNEYRTIRIPCENLPITKFNLSRSRIIELYKEGYKEGRKFIKRK